MADVRIGIAGTGFIARNLAREISRRNGYRVDAVLTRRPPHEVDGFDTGIVGNSLLRALDEIDVLVECSGDVVRATDVVSAAVERGLPVVTMNTEFHITTGSSFVGEGLVTEAAGDQPGCLAELHEEALALGFSPVAYGNMKGFLNEDPTPEDMRFWGDKQGISLAMVTSFTDGTKVQAEQILVANHFGGTIAQPGMLALHEDDLGTVADRFAEHAARLGQPIADYVVSSELPHGVFIVATHDEQQADALRYYKLGGGPNYVLVKPNIFVHLEILKTVNRCMTGGGVLLDNSQRPTVSLGAVAKRDLSPGETIPYAIGSFAARGHAVTFREEPDHVPIGLIQGATVTQPIGRGELLDRDKLELPESHALSRWSTIRRAVLDSEDG